MNWNVFEPKLQGRSVSGLPRPLLNLPDESLWTKANAYEAIVKAVAPDTLVRFQGTLWRVRLITSSLSLQLQQRVLVVGRDGNILYVEPFPHPLNPAT